MTQRIRQELQLSARDQTAGAIRSFTSNIGAAENAVRKFAAPLALVTGGVGFGALIKNSFESADALAKFADRLGISTERLAGLQYAASQTAGVTEQQLNIALQRMTRRVSEAAAGTGAAATAIEELGLNAREMARLTPDQQFMRIADAMSEVEGRSDQVRLAFRLFDSEGVALVNTLDKGSEGLEAFVQEADRLGIALDRVSAAQIEGANDAIDRARQKTVGWANSIAAGLAPTVTAIIDYWMDAETAAGDFATTTTEGLNWVTRSLFFAADAVNGLKVVWFLLRQAVSEVIEVMLLGISQVAVSAQSTFNAIARLIPKLEEAQFGTRAVEIYESFQSTNDSFLEELNRVANRAPPSDRLEVFYQRAKDAAIEAAESTAAARQQLFGDDAFAVADDTFAKYQANLEREAETLIKSLESVRNSLLDESGKIEQAYQSRLNILEANLRRGLISQSTYNELSVQLAEQREEKLNEIAMKGEQSRLNKEQAALQRGLESIQRQIDAQRSAKEQIEALYDEQFATLRGALEQGLIGYQEYSEKLIEIEKYRATETERIEKQSVQKRFDVLRSNVLNYASAFSTMFSGLEALAGASADTNEKAFKEQQKWARSAAVVNGAAAIIRAYAELGPIAGSIAAIGIGASVKGQLRTINKQTFGGNASFNAGSANIGYSNADTYQVPTGDQIEPTVNVFIDGSLQGMVREVRTYLQESGDEMIPSNSMNARRIRSAV